jgi:hypothetical protein
MEEVPGAQPPFAALDEQQTVSGEHEEVLLVGLGVVQQARISGPQHAQIDPELGERHGFTLEEAAGSERARLPRRVVDVDDEPTLGRRS